MNYPCALSQLASPGASVPQVWPMAHQQPGGTIRSLQALRTEGFFGAVLTVQVPDHNERCDIADVLAGSGLALTYCLTYVPGEQHLNLSALDGALRRRSLDAALRCLDDAREAGTQAVMIVSGPAPPALRIVIEPLDVSVHKKQTLGYRSESVALAQAVRRRHEAMSLCLDVAYDAERRGHRRRPPTRQVLCRRAPLLQLCGPAGAPAVRGSSPAAGRARIP